MNCREARQDLTPGFLDRLEGPELQSRVGHLRSCQECRQLAAAIEPTVIFSLIAAEPVADAEIEEVRQTVQAMRRVRALEKSWRRFAGRTAAGALAALLLVALLLVVREPAGSGSQTVPFAGALGVGSGLVEVPTSMPRAGRVELRFEAERALDPDRSNPGVERISQAVVSAQGGAEVRRLLGDGYGVRFVPVYGNTSGDLALQDFRLSRLDGVTVEELFRADLRPVAGQPIVLGLPPQGVDESRRWLRITWLNEAPGR